MWRTILSHKPDLLLLLGDNVYIDEPTNPDYQRYIYYRRQSQPDYRRLCMSTPVYAIWDDHDFGTDNCWGGPLADQPVWKRPVWRVFQQNWVNPAYGGGTSQPGCWFDFALGDVHFFMLDGRYYRTPRDKRNPDRLPSMLGPVQKRWLRQRLKTSTAALKVIASPVPWVGGVADKWNGFPEEREEIFSFLEANRIEGVLLLSADRHRSDLLVTRRPQGYDLYEFMSSKLTNHHTHKTIDERDGALFSYNKKCSFGLVTIDTTRADAEITYEIHTLDNERIHTFRLRRSQLTF
jgi:alkaline phosphatase D